MSSTTLATFLLGVMLTPIITGCAEPSPQTALQEAQQASRDAEASLAEMESSLEDLQEDLKNQRDTEADLREKLGQSRDAQLKLKTELADERQAREAAQQALVPLQNNEEDPRTHTETAAD